ncbi:MAG: hypothetical protein FWF59_11005 [Turicibacter sp.]|nr:hypothetical protein [Turicibacter sp.]
MTRTDNSIRNVKYAFIGQLLTMILTFVSRRIFLDVLGEQFLGLNSLLTSIINMLSLAELGIGASIIYSLYKPLAENDYDKIKSLMFFFKKAYYIIGFIIATIGLLLIPFLRLIIREFPSEINLYLVYFLFLINSVGSYFFVYKQSLLSADQKEYINTNVRTLFLVILNFFQIISLLLTRNYILFLFLQILSTFGINIVLSLRVDKLYPYLKAKKWSKISDSDSALIKKNVKALLMHRLGGFVVNSTDPLLIGILLNLVVVAQYGNYLMIINGLILIFSVIFQSLRGSLGNLGATANKNQIYQNFKKLNFIGFWIYSFSSICLYILMTPFVRLWLGEEMTLSPPIVIIIIINYYLRGMRQSTLTFRDSLGIFWYDRHKPAIEAFINITFSIFLGIHFGLLGILLGTLISTITTSFWVEPYVLFKYGFEKNVMDFFKDYLIYTTIGILALIGTYSITRFLPNKGLFDFIVITIITCFVSNFILILFFHRRKEFKSVFHIFKNRMFKLKQ